MPFAKSSHSLRARLGLTNIPTSVLMGTAILAFLAVLGIGVGFASFFGGGSGLTLESQEGSALEQEVTDEEEGASRSSEDLNAKAPGSAAEDAEQQSAAVSRQNGGVSSQNSFIKVHVAGCVKASGVYELPAGSRAEDAVRAAGGLTARASEGAVNLARPLEDGEQLYVPSKQEMAQGSVSIAQSSPSAPSEQKSSLVNINTASAEELDALPGVGPATAAAIISEREENGPFASLEDIQRVSGIGEKKYQDMKGSICV